jgi:hypothetical protein
MAILITFINLANPDPTEIMIIEKEAHYPHQLAQSLALMYGKIAEAKIHNQLLKDQGDKFGIGENEDAFASLAEVFIKANIAEIGIWQEDTNTRPISCRATMDIDGDLRVYPGIEHRPDSDTTYPSPIFKGHYLDFIRFFGSRAAVVRLQNSDFPPNLNYIGAACPVGGSGGNQEREKWMPES